MNDLATRIYADEFRIQIISEIKNPNTKSLASALFKADRFMLDTYALMDANTLLTHKDYSAILSACEDRIAEDSSFIYTGQEL